MYELGNTAELLNEIKYKVSILGLCETKWNGAGKMLLNTAKTVLFQTHSQWTSGSIAIKRGKSIIQWEEKSSRILTSTFSTTDKESKEECDPLLALTKVKGGSVKEKYYRKLQITIGYQRNCNLKTLLGDLTYCQNLM